jgi:hypothetical protein
VALVTVTVVLAGVLAVADALRRSARERRLDDTVRVQGSIEVSSSSNRPAGGRVDYFAAIRNTGPRSVFLRDVGIRQDGLRVTVRGRPREQLLRPGASAFVPLSVRLDCRERAAEAEGGPGTLRGVVDVRSNGGHRHVVPLAFAAVPLTDVAETLCRVGRPPFGELSGPIAGAGRG